MENQSEMRIFDMGSLHSNLPRKRGLSRYYSGKSRSFACMADIQCIEDLKKPEQQDAKKRKKYTNREMHSPVAVPPSPRRRVSSSTQCSTPLFGV